MQISIPQTATSTREISRTGRVRRWLCGSGNAHLLNRLVAHTIALFGLDVIQRDSRHSRLQFLHSLANNPTDLETFETF